MCLISISEMPTDKPEKGHRFSCPSHAAWVMFQEEKLINSKLNLVPLQAPRLTSGTFRVLARRWNEERGFRSSPTLCLPSPRQQGSPKSAARPMTLRHKSAARTDRHLRAPSGYCRCVLHFVGMAPIPSLQRHPKTAHGGTGHAADSTMLKDVDAECDRLPRDLYDEEVHAGVDVNAVPSESGGRARAAALDRAAVWSSRSFPQHVGECKRCEARASCPCIQVEFGRERRRGRYGAYSSPSARPTRIVEGEDYAQRCNLISPRSTESPVLRRAPARLATTPTRQVSPPRECKPPSGPVTLPSALAFDREGQKVETHPSVSTRRDHDAMFK
ncbi:hypothetical protein L1887_43417 [Cichorium endivia]|nr:hypothetical protein L1887_43417 [Cichorium endivia]